MWYHTLKGEVYHYRHMTVDTTVELEMRQNKLLTNLKPMRQP